MMDRLKIALVLSHMIMQREARSVDIRRMLELCGGVGKILKSSERTGTEGLDYIIEHIKRRTAETDIEEAYEKAKQLNIKTVIFKEKEYPSRLAHLNSPPPILFYRSVYETKILDNPTAAVIGSRRPSVYGRKVTEGVTRELIKKGAVIVSGMARGIDSIAHEEAIRYGGYTVAVAGCGPDRTYPPENELLMEKIIKNGMLISEYPPGVRPARQHFPARNRIISGLSDCVIITEASENSGTMITAGFAADQGRDVYAVPGSIYSSLSEGTNKLIQEGAFVLTSVEDVKVKLI